MEPKVICGRKEAISGKRVCECLLGACQGPDGAPITGGRHLSTITCTCAGSACLAAVGYFFPFQSPCDSPVALTGAGFVPREDDFTHCRICSLGITCMPHELVPLRAITTTSEAKGHSPDEQIFRAKAVPFLDLPAPPTRTETVLMATQERQA